MNKNIHDLSDEEFDDLFRESAEKSEVDFDPEAWKKMTQKLDAADNPASGSGTKGSPFGKWILPTAIILLLLIIGSYFVLKKPTTTTIGTLKDKHKENAVNKEANIDKKYVTTDKVDTEDLTTHKNQEKEATNTANLPKPANTEKLLNTTNNKKTTEGGSLSSETDNKIIAEKKTGNKLKTNTDSDFSTKAKQKSFKSNAVVKEKNRLDTHPTNTGISARNEASSKRLANGLAENKPVMAINEITRVQKRGRSLAKQNSNIVPAALKDKAGLNNKSLETEAQTSTMIADSSSQTIEKIQWGRVSALSPRYASAGYLLKLPQITFTSPEQNSITDFIAPQNTAFKRGLGIRLALSPDFSFIPSNSFVKVGHNWAALIEYRFNNRLSLQAGVIRSLKLYNAMPDQYEWSSYWTTPPAVKDIDATCKMLDIPVNIRYDISQKANSRWFVSSGFTSYVMLKETYRYNYTNPNDPNIKRTGWEGKTGTYPFSVLNFSVGYEHQLFRRLSFQIEPFYKQPLGKVGYGKVRLATTGVFFSVKYPLY
ncbi:hypothetical protein [Emticicia sp. 17c]|uniref:hypothetical protein n=1 Tax=Emticicia sp. 17c TaxID=3127704 RepID=UPI00301C0179